MSSPSDSRASILQRIIKLSEDFIENTQPTCDATSPRHGPPPTLCLPTPPSLIPSLLAMGGSLEIATAMEKKYLANAAELRAYMESVISRACSRVDSRTQGQIISVFTSYYLRQLEGWVITAGDVLKARLSAAGSVSGRNRRKDSPAFNQEYVPLLEHFFDENPFPTHADKAFLAKKSGMTLRQIHVWFQNRRNRTRKDGKSLRKKPMSEGATLPLDTLRQRMNKYIIPQEGPTKLSAVADTFDSSSSPRTETVTRPFRASDVANSQLSSILDAPAPPHAFPAPYPPSCPYDPFPIKAGMECFQKPEWPQRNVSARSQSSPVTISEITDKFAQLSVRDDLPRYRRKESSPTPDSCAATRFITVKPSCAPHPALIRHPYICPSIPLSPVRAVAAPVTRLRVFDPPNPGAQLATLASPFGKGDSTKNGLRKIAPLPRQMRPAVSCTHHGDNPSRPFSPSQLQWQGRVVSSSSSICSDLPTPEGSPSHSNIQVASPSPSPLSTLPLPPDAFEWLDVSCTNLFKGPLLEVR